ncbi:MAG: hypothetical protein GTN81_08740 [Proteobacteria bacterium]|nr:hypothetical protein [Pseudomonadota bacterium]
MKDDRAYVKLGIPKTHRERGWGGFGDFSFVVVDAVDFGTGQLRGN